MCVLNLYVTVHAEIKHKSGKILNFLELDVDIEHRLMNHRSTFGQDNPYIFANIRLFL